MNLNFTLIIQIISFLIFLGLLTRYFYKPFMGYLDRRSQELKAMIEETRKNREASQEVMKKAQDELRATKQEVLQMKNATAKEADEHRRLSMEETKKEASSLLERAKKDIKKEVAEAKGHLKSEMALLSVKIARKILGREVKEQDHKKLIKDSIRELNKTN